MNERALYRPGFPEPVSEAAAAWVLLQEEGPLSDDDERRRAAWIAEDPAHFVAYENALWALDAVARNAGEPEILSLRKAALEARGSQRRVWRWTASLGLVAAAVAGVFLFSPSANKLPGLGIATRIASGPADPAHGSYRTAIGERSVITLPDGSILTLDTDSQVRIDYSSRERGVHLLKGQALFEVAKGKPMPFQVYAHDQRITAIGTVFNVRLDGDEVRVAMVEGVVKVRRSVSDNPSLTSTFDDVTLSAGEELRAEPAQPILVKAADVQQVASWKGGVLIFNDTRLSDAVAEINRYTTRPIAIADGAVGSYRVSGVFKSNDPEHFSQAMAEVLPIMVTHAPDGAPTLRSSGN